MMNVFNVYIVYDDVYDRNVICVTTDYSAAVAAFHAHNDELIANGHRPNVEQEKDQLIETHPLILGKGQVMTGAADLDKLTEMIDRQSALSVCKEYCWYDDTAEIREDAFIDGYNTAVKDISEAIKELPKVNRWISVKDALPEIYEKVLTADIDGYVTENYRCSVRAGLEWLKGFQITHWMPKPEPPKEDET